MQHHLRRWQPQLRSLFVMRIESFKYRLQVSGYELAEIGRTAQHAYDDRFAAVLRALPHTPSAAFWLGVAQSLHTNSRDEALGLPAEETPHFVRHAKLSAGKLAMKIMPRRGNL
jgi:hypothetical protein